MSSKKKARGEDFKPEDVLQAVVIADSFNVRFAPVTYNKPRTLLPLVNTPLLDYTLEFLCSAGIQECIVFCCAHADQVKQHVESSKWGQGSSPMEVLTLVSESCLSVGDALREIDSHDSLIHNDFVLVNGDLISNVKLKPLIEKHKARRLKEKTPIMTMLLKKVPPGHRTRCTEDEVMVAVKKDNDRILYYKKAGNYQKFDFPVELFEDNSHLDLRYDLLNCHISICSPQVPTLFTDNFDYQTQEDFVKGILDNEEILGNTIHLHVVQDEYAAGVSNLQMYDAISKDIINRWVYPIVAENVSSQQGNRYTYGRHNVYLHRDVTLARGCVLEEDVVIGQRTTVGSNAFISQSVIGNNCQIGENVRLEGAYIWDNVKIEDHCEVQTSLLDCDVHLKKNVNVEQGCILETKVVVGPDVTLKEGAMLSARPRAADSSFQDEEEMPEAAEDVDKSLVGPEGSGYLYSPESDSDQEDDDIADDPWGLKVEAEISDVSSSDAASNSEDFELGPAEIQDEMALFYDEFIGTIERAMQEDIKTDNVVLEVNSLKHAYGLQIKEVNLYVTKGILEYPLLSKPSLEAQEYLASLRQNFKKLLPLLKNYIRNEESQRDCLTAIEELAISSPTVHTALQPLLKYLYDQEILEEESLIGWHRSSLSTEDIDLRKKVRQQVQKLISWLEEAEEESESD